MTAQRTSTAALAGPEHWTHKGDIRIAYHVLHAFFSQPDPIYRG